MMPNRLAALNIDYFSDRPQQRLSMRTLDTLPECALVLDADWRVRHLNPIAEGLLELSDDINTINDSAGHAAGDTAICEVAARMQGTIRGRDTLARMGGDEFGLLLKRCPAQHARQRAEELHQAISAYPLHWQGSEFRLGISIGLVILNSTHHSVHTVLTTADAACYQAKRRSDTGPHIQ